MPYYTRTEQALDGNWAALVEDINGQWWSNSASGFTAWVYRTNTTATVVNWVALGRV